MKDVALFVDIIRDSIFKRQNGETYFEIRS